MRPHETPGAWEWDRGPTGRLVKIVYTALRRELERLARQAGLTAAQWSALGVLYHFPGATNADLEAILLIERPSVTSLIQGMEQKGWVVRVDDPEDGRSKRIYLTESGKTLAEQTRSFADAADGSVLGALTGDERAELRRLLEKVIRSTRSYIPSHVLAGDGPGRAHGASGTRRRRGDGAKSEQP